MPLIADIYASFPKQPQATVTTTLPPGINAELRANWSSTSKIDHIVVNDVEAVPIDKTIYLNIVSRLKIDDSVFSPQQDGTLEINELVLNCGTSEDVND